MLRDGYTRPACPNMYRQQSYYDFFRSCRRQSGFRAECSLGCRRFNLRGGYKVSFIYNTFLLGDSVKIERMHEGVKNARGYLSDRPFFLRVTYTNNGEPYCRKDSQLEAQRAG